MKRILITGGAGFIGSHLIDHLLKMDQVQVRILDNLNHPNSAWVDEYCKDSHLEFIYGDVRHLSTVIEAVKNCDLIFHLAAQSNVMRAEADPVYAFETNVNGTFNVLHSALKNDVGQVVFTSSREVYGDSQALPVAENAPLLPRNVYGVSKVTGELQCRLFRDQYGLDVRVVRLSNVYGPGDSGRVIPLFCQAVQNGQPLTLYGGDQIIDFVWVKDAIRALWEVSQLMTCNEPINCGSGHGITVRQLAEQLCAVSQTPVELKVMPGRSVEVSRFIADTTRICTILGWSPDGQLMNYLADVLESYKTKM
jgi:UDP-glucose 4-epimerase